MRDPCGPVEGLPHAPASTMIVALLLSEVSARIRHIELASR